MRQYALLLREREECRAVCTPASGEGGGSLLRKRQECRGGRSRGEEARLWAVGGPQAEVWVDGPTGGRKSEQEQSTAKQGQADTAGARSWWVLKTRRGARGWRWEQAVLVCGACPGTRRRLDCSSECEQSDDVVMRRRQCGCSFFLRACSLACLGRRRGRRGRCRQEGGRQELANETRRDDDEHTGKATRAGTLPREWR